MKRRITNGEEQGVHTPWRKLLVSFSTRPGVTSRAKRRTRRRERREGKAELRREIGDA